MSRIIKIIKVLRNNWKKTVFFSGLALYGAHYGHGKYLEFNLMKAYCQEAKQYGLQKLSPIHSARHVTVILNPVANKKKGKADYEKYSAPLFHLAGLKVSLVTTEEEGQAKDLMEIMDNTDCVVVAGGDGTVHETITGLMRRNDANFAVQRFPIGIVPIGQNNSIAYKLNSFDPKVDTKAKILAESSMCVIRQVLNEVNVMKIEGEQGRPVFSLGQINMGQIRNTMSKVDQYWYLGKRMRPYLAFFFQSFKDLTKEWDPSKTVSVSYTNPCTGCSKCYHRFAIFPENSSSNDLNQAKSTSKRWWQMFLPRINKSSTSNPINDVKNIELERMKNNINDDCDQLNSLDINSKNILIRNSHDNTCLELIVHPNDLKRSQFVSEGIRIYKHQELDDNKNPPVYQVIRAKDYSIKLAIENESSPILPEEPLVETNPSINVIEPLIESDKLNANKFRNNNNMKIDESKFSLLDSNEFRKTSIKELDSVLDSKSLITLDETPMVPLEKKSKNESPLEELVESQVPGAETNTDIEVQTNKNEDTDDTNTRWLAIDNENYEIQSELKISLIPKKVQIYYNQLPQ